MKAKKTDTPALPRAPRKRAAKPALATAAAVSATPSTPTSHQVESPPPADQAAPSLAVRVEQLRTGELASRIEAAAKLGEMPEPQAVAALAEALRDPTAEVAREAAVALRRSRLPSAVDALTAVIENADGYFHPIVRTAAAESLGCLNEPRAVGALKRAVRDPLAEPSRAAIRALGVVAREDALPALLAVVSNGDNYFLPSVRVTATEVLATIPAPAARDCLRSLAENPGEVAEVRLAARQAVG